MHVRRALALSVLAPLLLAGCSDGDPEPSPTPKMPDPTSASPSPTESETAEAESAEDFVRRWVQVSNEMQQTGEVAEFRKLSRQCQSCGQAADQVQSIYEAGGSIEFGGATISLLKSVADDPPTFNLDLDTPETVVRLKNGQVDQRLPSGVGQYQLTLNGEPGAWFVAAYARR
ncbi:hypothetical protein [Nocardioides zeicaulis]|uniref:Lipoprotein n=1 Tax=Nocardioides zeicaulis TaxID=1776857 RepID=A0ABV6DZH7_9ACTN